MRQLVSGLTLFVAMCLLAPVSDARAPKPSNFTVASVQFWDFVPHGDGIGNVPARIKSDGGPYVDGGQRGLEVRMWTGGSQDLTIGTFSSGRTLYFDYSDRVTGTGPLGAMYDNAFVNIRAIADMGRDEIRTTKASFNTAVGHFRWLGSPVPAGGFGSGDSFGSQAIVVKRTDQITWEVYTPVPQDSLTVPGVTAGDLNVLLKSVKNTLTPIGNYRMPFKLTVTCATCTYP